MKRHRLYVRETRPGSFSVCYDDGTRPRGDPALRSWERSVGTFDTHKTAAAYLATIRRNRPREFR